MKKKLWILKLPILVLCSSCFWVTELGVQGGLENDFLREKFYPTLSRAAHLLTDFKFTVRGPQHPKNKIVVLEIDNSAIARLGRWPWHRDVIAYLVDKTFSMGAKVVGLDIVFSEADPRIPEALAALLKSQGMGATLSQFDTDQQLKEVIRRHSDHLVLGWTSDMACQPFYEEPQYCAVTDPEAIKQFSPLFEKYSIKNFNNVVPFQPARTPLVSFVVPIPNLPAYDEVGKHAGYFNAVLDSDGYIRRTHLFAFGNAKPYASLAFEMARVGMGQNIQITLDSRQRVLEVGFKESRRNIPVTPLASMQINFRGPSSVFTHLSAEDVMSDKGVIEDPMNKDLVGHSVTEVLKDAYVLIGITAVGVFDMRQFPFESNAAGVYGHANILDNLLSGDPLVSGSNGFGSWFILFLMIFGVSVFAYLVEVLDAVPALFLFVASYGGLGFLDIGLLFRRNYNLNTVFLYLEMGTVFVLILAAKYVLEERNKKFIRGAFSKYVAPLVVDSILKDPKKLSLGGEKRELTILFSDIRGFTTFSESMDAKALASFLNDYLGIMTALVFKNHGTLDKYIGDAIMAFWGAPLNQPAHAFYACKTAFEMMEALKKNRERFKSQYGIDVDIGIGINSGIVNVGNMGSEQNFEYTVIGDHVNLASRVESLTKKYGTSIVTTRFTLDCISRSGSSSFPCRILDVVKVKGKKNSVELIQLLDESYSQEGLQLFEEARALYHNRQWDFAQDLFQKAQRLLKGSGPASKMDGPCEVYSERCKYFKENPPEAEWDGSWEMESK